MNTLSRTFAGLVVGATLLGGAAVACATPDTPEGYVSEMRENMREAESSAMSDQQLIEAGRMMCSVPSTLDGAAESDAPPEYITYTEITKRYCGVLGTDPAMAALAAGAPPPVDTGAGVAPQPSVVPPKQIEVGKPNALNYGGQDVVTWTVNKIDWCGAYLRLDVTMTTSDLYVPGQDNFAHRTQWTDTDGITHDNPGIMAFDCGEELPQGYSAQPGRTYRGVMTFDVPRDRFESLDVYGSDQAHYILRVG